MSINDRENPHVIVTWDKLKTEDGAKYLQFYQVLVTIEVRKSDGNIQKRQINRQEQTFTVDKTENILHYDNIEPFMSYTFQVNADLLLNGEKRLVPITQPKSVVSAEAGTIIMLMTISIIVIK